MLLGGERLRGRSTEVIDGDACQLKQADTENRQEQDKKRQADFLHDNLRKVWKPSLSDRL